MTPPALDWVDELEAVREHWQRLGRASGNVFLTWEWASAWCRHLNPGRRPLVAAATSDGGVPAALVPLYPGSHRGIPALRMIGDGLGGRVGPVCAAGQEELGAAALARAVADAPGRHLLFVGQGLPGESRWERSLPAAVHHRDRSPVLRIGGASWDQYLGSRSRNFRQQVRRRERRLRERHEVRLRLADRSSLRQDMETLFRLHAARWRERPSSAFAGPRRDFHLEFAQLALERGWLRLWLLELDGRPAAAWHGFRFGGAEWYYQSGRTPEHDDEAVGFVLLAHTVRCAIEDGMREYRFLLGDEPYKLRFTSDDPGDSTVLAPIGALGRLVLGVAAGRRAARAALASAARRSRRLGAGTESSAP